MLELIDKEAAYIALKREAEAHMLPESHEAYIRAARIIDQMKPIEAEPVRHGHWIFREEATPEYLPWDMWCSCCGEYHDSDDYNDRYCSKCGAKMDADGGTISKERFAEIGGADNG